MFKTMLKVLCGATLLMAICIPVHADTIVVFNNTNGCGGSSCFGNVVTLTIHPTGGNAYQVTMTVDTTNNTNTGSGIGGVDFKFSSTGILSANLTAAPGGVAGWSGGVTNGLNSNGCTTTNGSSFGCATDTAFLLAGSSLASLPNNGVYTWQWDVTAGAFDPTTNSIHAGVLFGSLLTTGGPHGSTSFQSTGIISASGLGSTPPPPNNPVPEPGSLVLFGTGLIGLANVVRRRLS
ncbi:MAG TPA: PEP-CTERM sorting domain-containing protein [Candidatus Acidoferrales bacterium]|jgi:hypothetical protein|nr:PEP-CTERM sorting domain-containing protein [Candidatus Acidoferrales bacterium]